ncbi:unnamed protein product [Effrenium voratum]|nr:unnamed protein product [Effrenium voratum]
MVMKDTSSEDSTTECSTSTASSACLQEEVATRWSAVRRRAWLRSAAATLLALAAIFVPVCTYAASEMCSREVAMPYTQHSLSLEEPATWEVVFTAIMSMICLGLVLYSQMKWWLASPFLILLRWHVLLDAVNVWLFHYLSVQPFCAVTAEWQLAMLSWLSVFSQIFFWWNKFMGFYIIKNHLGMLERAFQRSLGASFLDLLHMSFGVAVLTASVLFVVFNAMQGDAHWLVASVIIIEIAVVVSTLFVMVLMMRGFGLAYRYARMERTAATSEVQRELAAKSVTFSKRMSIETPINMILVAAGFTSHAVWLIHVHFPGNSMCKFGPATEPVFLFMAVLSLTNCARFGAILSLMEVSERRKRAGTWRKGLSMMLSSSRDLEEWSTGHPDWDAKVADLASRAVTLGALLDFYSSLPERMPHFDPEKHTTEQVVRQAIIPMSRGTIHGDCPAAIVLMGEALMPDLMVTHSWSNRFACLVAAVVADALEVPGYTKVLRDGRLKPGELEVLKSELFWKGKLEKRYWICAFSVNQHMGICGFVPPSMQDPVTGLAPKPCYCEEPKCWSDTEPLRDGQSVNCEMNKFDDMMSYLAYSNPSFAQLIAVDMNFNLFTRAWCVAEIHCAQQKRMTQRMSIFSEANLKQHEQWLHMLRVEEMRASNPADTQRILSKIEDKELFDRELQCLIFDEDGLVQACFAGFGKVNLLGKIAQRGLLRQGS